MEFMVDPGPEAGPAGVPVGGGPEGGSLWEMVPLILVLLAYGAVPGLIFGLKHKNFWRTFFAGWAGGILGAILFGVMAYVLLEVGGLFDDSGGLGVTQNGVYGVLFFFGFLFGGSVLGALIMGWRTARAKKPPLPDTRSEAGGLDHPA